MFGDNLKLRFTESDPVQGLRLRIKGKEYEYGSIIYFKENI
jgi:hypothetical protein